MRRFRAPRPIFSPGSLRHPASLLGTAARIPLPFPLFPRRAVVCGELCAEMRLRLDLAVFVKSTARKRPRLRKPRRNDQSHGAAGLFPTSVLTGVLFRSEDVHCVRDADRSGEFLGRSGFSCAGYALKVSQPQARTLAAGAGKYFRFPAKVVQHKRELRSAAPPFRGPDHQPSALLIQRTASDIAAGERIRLSLLRSAGLKSANDIGRKFFQRIRRRSSRIRPWRSRKPSDSEPQNRLGRGSLHSDLSGTNAKHIVASGVGDEEQIHASSPRMAPRSETARTNP